MRRNLKIYVLVAGSVKDETTALAGGQAMTYNHSQLVITTKHTKDTKFILIYFFVLFVNFVVEIKICMYLESIYNAIFNDKLKS